MHEEWPDAVVVEEEVRLVVQAHRLALVGAEHLSADVPRTLENINSDNLNTHNRCQSGVSPSADLDTISTHFKKKGMQPRTTFRAG